MMRMHFSFNKTFTKLRSGGSLLKKYYKHHSLVFNIVGAIVSAFLGGYVSLVFFEPYQYCQQSEANFLSALSFVSAEIQLNRRILIRAEQHIDELSTGSETTIEQKQGNLFLAAKMLRLHTSGYIYANQQYLTLPLVLKEKYKVLFEDVSSIYGLYTDYNESVGVAQTTIIASLGFRADLYSNYLPLQKQILLDMHDVLKRIGSDPVVEIEKETSASNCHFLNSE